MRTISGSEITVDYALIRPPTSAYRERDGATNWRQLEFPATASQGCRIRLVNIEGAFPEIGALEELIVPVGRGIRSGAYGQFILGVVTSDQPVIDYVESLAERHRLPIFLARSTEQPLESSSPLGRLTPAEFVTLEKVQELGGRVTSSQLAAALDLELAAAGNRLSKIEQKGYLLRVERSPREGDLYIDPRQALSVTEPVSQSEPDGYIPGEIREAVAIIAKKQGRSAEDIVGEVWRDFFHRNKEELGQEYIRIGKLFDSGDARDLEDQLGEDIEDWAKEASRAWDDE